MFEWPAKKSSDLQQLPAPEDDHDRALFANIKKIGWSVIQIHPDQPGDQSPLYSFSVGLYHRFKHPEIILLGLRPEVAGPVINNIGVYILLGNTLVPEKEYGHFMGPGCVVFKTVDPRHYEKYVGYARWLYRGSSFPMLQCVWPLKSGLFPWDAGYPPEGAAYQPFLGTV